VERSLDLLLYNAPDKKVQQIQVQRLWQPIRRSPEFRHGFPQELLCGSGGVSQLRILLKDVIVIRICLLDPGNHMLPQKVFINNGVDPFASTNENDGTFLAVAATPRTICFNGALDLGKMRIAGSTLAIGRSVK
jgi:hypothetical protein